jgi:4-hydroxybenzoate polyprenyltransferase
MQKTPQSKHTAPADSEIGWLISRLPPRGQAFAQLARLDRPIGTWLLFWPCFWGMALAAAELGSLPPLTPLIAFAIGALAMRGAGCTYNDIVDRALDAQVARTALRPLPSGRVSVNAAWGFFAAQMFVGFLVLIWFQSLFMVALGIAALGLVAAYPFMKRITYWPQAWLGLTFNWGALMGYAAITDNLTPPAFALYAAGLFWTLGYDTIYAHQDKEDDALIGVKSTALLFGARTKQGLSAFYAAALGGLGTAAYLAELGPLFWAALPVVGWHLLMQVSRLDIDKPEVCLQIFRANRNTGLIIAIAFILGSF